MDLREELARLRQSRRSLSPRDAHALLLRAGFEWRPARGDHRLYRHPVLGLRVGLDWRDPLLPAYVKRVIVVIEAVLDASESNSKEKPDARN